jgi:hypothetical protein
MKEKLAYSRIVKNLATTEMLVGNAILVYDRQSDTFHALGITIGVVWRMYGSNITHEDIVQKVSEFYDGEISQKQISKDIYAAFNALLEAGLFIKSSKPVRLPKPTEFTVPSTNKLSKYEEFKIKSYDRQWIEKNHPSAYFELVRYLTDTWGPQD